jgi:hypothetical protein
MFLKKKYQQINNAFENIKKAFDSGQIDENTFIEYAKKYDEIHYCPTKNKIFL